MEYILDLSDIYSADELHDLLEEVLPLPEYYGRNLDALHDALSDLPALQLTVRNIEVPEAVMGRYMRSFRAVLSDLAEEIPGFSVTYPEEAP